jgi:hypothetical protein
VGCSRSRAAAALLLLLGACAREKAQPWLRVAREAAGPGLTRLTLQPTAGVRINARLAPALERPDGSVLAFLGARLTPDSSYFVDPPSLQVRGPVAGQVRASVCPEEEKICVPVTLTLRD